MLWCLILPFGVSSLFTEAPACGDKASEACQALVDQEDGIGADGLQMIQKRSRGKNMHSGIDPTETAQCSFEYPGKALTCFTNLTVGCCSDLNSGVHNGPPCQNDFDKNAAAMCFKDMDACCSTSTPAPSALVEPVATAAPGAIAPAATAAAATPTGTAAAEALTGSKCDFPFPEMDLQLYPAGRGHICSVMVTESCCKEIKASVHGGAACNNTLDITAAAICFKDIAGCCAAPATGFTVQVPTPAPATAPAATPAATPATGAPAAVVPAPPPAEAPVPLAVPPPVAVKTAAEPDETPEEKKVTATTGAPTAATTVAAFAPKMIPDGRALSMNCTGHGSPIQVMKVNRSYTVAELDIQTGEYTKLFDVPFELVQGFFTELNGCGVNPIDNIIYCTMYASLTSYIVRLSPGVVEFVAKLKSWTVYNTGNFNPAGTFFVANNTADFLVIPNLHMMKGSNQRNGLANDFSNSPTFKPAGWFSVSDVVTYLADYAGTGTDEEYLASVAGPRVLIAKWGGQTAGFVNSWVLQSSVGDWGEIWGAGWSFNGRIFFASNKKGRGVYEVPVRKVSLVQQSNITLTYVGPSQKAFANDGMNCLYSPDPWVTKVFPFDCSSHAAPLQLTQSAAGISIKKLNLESGLLIDIYDVPFTKTEPAFRFLNAVGINPMDGIPYGALMTEKAPGNMYIVRFDWEKIEFVGQLKGSFNPIAGCFDQKGNFFFVSHPDGGNGTLYKIPNLDEVRGYKSMDNASLADYSGFAGVSLPETYQMADIVAITYDVNGQGDLQDYVLGINRDQQVIVIEWHKEAAASRVWKFYTNNVLGAYGAKLNFGAAWNFGGRLMFASNDGIGVFEAVDYNASTGFVQLQEVGKSSSVEITDGFNCPSASPFWGNKTAVKQPTIGRMW